MLFKILGFVYCTIHCSLARNSLVIWSNVTEDQFLNYVLASCLIFKKKKQGKIMPDCVMPNDSNRKALCRHWYLPVLSPQERQQLLVWCLLPVCWPPSHPGAPSSSCFSWVKFSERTPLSQLIPCLISKPDIFAVIFFQCLSPQKVSCHFRKLDQTPTWGLKNQTSNPSLPV